MPTCSQDRINKLESSLAKDMHILYTTFLRPRHVSSLIFSVLSIHFSQFSVIFLFFKMSHKSEPEEEEIPICALNEFDPGIGETSARPHVSVCFFGVCFHKLKVGLFFQVCYEPKKSEIQFMEQWKTSQSSSSSFQKILTCCTANSNPFPSIELL